MKNKIIVRSLCLCAALLVSNVATAQNILKSDTATMDAAADWSGNAPTASNVGEFGSTPLAATLAAMTLGGAVSLAGLQLDNNMNGPLTIAADGNTLTLGASGIDMSAANQNATLGCLVTLGSAQNWNVVSPETLTVSGVVTLNDLLTLNGSGAVTLSAANTGTGGLTISNGFVTFGNAAAAGGASGGTLTLGGGTLFMNGLNIANAVNVTGNTLVTNGLTAAQFNGNWTGAGTVTIIEGTNSTVTFTATSGLSGFAGTIKMSDLQPIVGFIRFSGSASGSSAATFDLGNGYSVMHTRNGQAVSLGALKGGPNSTIEGARSATASGTTYSIGLNNTSTTFYGLMTNGTVTGNSWMALTKVGTGTLTLVGTNNADATGPTEVSAGTLQIGDGNANGSFTSGNTIIDAGGTLAFDRPDNYTTINSIANSGALTIIGGGTNTYNTGAYTGAGAINVINGGFVMASPAATLGTIYVGPGMTFDASQDASLTSVLGLSGSGTINVVGGSLTAVTVTGGISPGGSGTAGTLTINGGLIESGGVNNQFVLSQVGGTNDFLVVKGSLNVSSGTQTISLSEFGGGAVPPGVYPLISYTGTLTGGTNNFSVSAIGFSGTVTNITSVTPNEIAVIVTPATRPALNLTWVGDAANHWDLTTVHDWVNGGTNYVFQAGDSALFTDSGSANPPVNLQGNMFPAALVVSNTTKNYIFTGSGSIAGTTGLTKTNGGKLTLLTTNSYTGPTVIGGGVLELETGALLASGTAGAIGAASSDPSNLVFYGSTFRYSGMDTNRTDHGMTIVSGVTVDVTNAAAVFTASGVVTGRAGRRTLDESGSRARWCCRTSTPMPAGR